MLGLFSGPCPLALVNETLAAAHYLGAAKRGFGWSDGDGCLVLAKPTSRMLPSDGTWLELARWCLTSKGDNAGSAQWSRVRRWIIADHREVTTVVSYSDPSVGHTGALYRASGWRWAPTWHRLRPPPTGNGTWAAEKIEAVKDRWVDPIRADQRRPGLLAVRDESLLRRMPWASWQEPRLDSKGLCRRGEGGGDFLRWRDSRDTGTPGGGS